MAYWNIFLTNLMVLPILYLCLKFSIVNNVSWSFFFFQLKNLHIFEKYHQKDERTLFAQRHWWGLSSDVYRWFIVVENIQDFNFPSETERINLCMCLVKRENIKDRLHHFLFNVHICALARRPVSVTKQMSCIWSCAFTFVLYLDCAPLNQTDWSLVQHLTQSIPNLPR